MNQGLVNLQTNVQHVNSRSTEPSLKSAMTLYLVCIVVHNQPDSPENFTELVLEFCTICFDVSLPLEELLRYNFARGGELPWQRGPTRIIIDHISPHPYISGPVFPIIFCGGSTCPHLLYPTRLCPRADPAYLTRQHAEREGKKKKPQIYLGNHQLIDSPRPRLPPGMLMPADGYPRLWSGENFNPDELTSEFVHSFPLPFRRLFVHGNME